MSTPPPPPPKISELRTVFQSYSYGAYIYYLAGSEKGIPPQNAMLTRAAMEEALIGSDIFLPNDGSSIHCFASKSIVCASRPTDGVARYWPNASESFWVGSAPQAWNYR